MAQGAGLAGAYGIRRNGKDPYADGVEIHGNLEEAVVKELYERGYPTPPGQNESGYCVVIFVKGAGGWSGVALFLRHAAAGLSSATGVQGLLGSAITEGLPRLARQEGVFPYHWSMEMRSAPHRSGGSGA